MAFTDEKIRELIEEVKNVNLTKDEKDKVAEQLATFMKNEGIKLGNYPITEDNWGNNNSLFKIFNELIDLDSQQNETLLEYIENILKEREPATIEDWNESVKEMLNYFRTHFKPYSQRNEITANGEDTEGNLYSLTMSILDYILKANAGYSFNGDNPWVMPNKNIDGNTYSEVRNNDKIEAVLNSQKNMNFTHTQTTGELDENGKQKDTINMVTKYIRLIMPRYTRRVEVEDLNRNFWVIGQVLTAISAYLFDKDSPITNTLKRLISENVQIWENLLYIWAALYSISQKDYVPYDNNHIRCEVVYLPNNNWNHEMKFDGYDINNPQNLEDCEERLQYLVDMYPDKHLCVVPVVRNKNYFKNYYNEEIYYGILCYDRNLGQWSQEIKFNNDNGVVIKVEDGDKLYYIKEGQGVYPYCEPEATITTVDNSWIQAVRSYVSSFTCDFENSIFLPKLVVEIYDAGKYAITGEKQPTIIAINYGNANPYYANPRTRYLETHGTNKDTDGIRNKGIYLCELITRMKSPEQTGPSPIGPSGDLQFKVVNIGSFFPADILSHNTGKRFEMITSTDPEERFNIQTYGYGCYCIKSNALTQYSTNTKLYFMRNYSFYNTPAATYDQTTFSGLARYQEDVQLANLKTWGKEYIQALYNDNKLTNNTVYITRIGVSYWTGSNGTVWNNGIFCDIFVILNNKVEYICPLYLFDGYWTNNSLTFAAPSGGSAWRQLAMTGTGTYQTIDSDVIFNINGTLQWNDHNKEIGLVPGDGTTNRPQCSFVIDTSRAGEKITWSNYFWPDALRGTSTVSPEQMTMFINKNSIWSSSKTISSNAFYNFAPNTSYLPLSNSSDGYILVGANDYNQFTFGTRYN